jgi:MSHA biogenesis protein MshJ
MAEVLKNVLGKSGKLTLLGLTGLGAQPLTGLPAAAQAPAGKPEVPPVATVVAYRHGLRIEVAGSYLDVLAYLHGLETLPWKFLWDSVDYKVKSYPQGTATIVVYTLSLDPAWIGI